LLGDVRMNYRHIGLGFMLSGLSHMYRGRPGFYFEAFFARRPDGLVAQTYGITERGPYDLNNPRNLYIGFMFRLWGRLYGVRLLTWEITR